MACALEQINTLQIREEYKQGLIQFCQNPENAQACAELCAAGPEAIVEAFTEAEVSMQQMAQGGIPEELLGGLSQSIPELAQTQTQTQGAVAQNFANGGLASLGRYNDDQMAHVQTGEMVVPVKVLRSNPQLAQGIARAIRAEGVSPERFQVGGIGSYNPSTGMQEFGFLSKVWKTVKKIAPIALAVVAPSLGPALFSGTAAAGWSAATWSAIGGGLGTKIAGGSWGDALAAGAMSYGASALLNPASTSSNPYYDAPNQQTSIAPNQQGSYVDESGFEVSKPQSTSISGGGGNGGAQRMMTADATPTYKVDPDLNNVQNLAERNAYNDLYGIKPPSVLSDPIGWWDDQSGISKVGMGLAAATGVAGLTGALDAPPIERPAGYNMQTDPDQQYGGRPYETRQGRLMAGLDNSDAGIATVGATTPQDGYSFGLGNTAIPQYGHLMTPEELEARERAYQASIQGYSNAPTYGQLNAANGGYINGAGTETSDSIPANLSNNEFVMTAQAVRGAGKGNIREGAKRMYRMMDELERRA
jgi:hypothetical protein